ncbi:MAG: prolyl oligopeptidase family serine peptidase [Saprospiraceae bacterium]
MKKVLGLFLLILCNTTLWSQTYQPVSAKKISTVDTFFNEYLVEDNYQWLEEINKNAATEWIENQRKLSKKYLSKCSNKTNSLRTINKYAYAEYDVLNKQGDYYFQYSYYNALGVPALFYKPILTAKMRMLVDPNYISYKDKITLKEYKVSNDSKYLAYQFSRNGSDWMEIKVVSLKNGAHKKDHLKGIKYSSIAWLEDGFFYSTIAQSGQFGKATAEAVYYHKIGTTQAEDKLIFKRKNSESIILSFSTTTDNRFFILKEKNEKTEKTNLFYIDYHSDQKKIRPLVLNLEEGIVILKKHHKGKLIALTSHNANKGRIVEIDPANPYNWREVAPAYSDALLLKSFCFSDRIVGIYQKNHQPMLVVYDYSGATLFTQKMGMATVLNCFSTSDKEDEFSFYSTSYVQPPVTYTFNVKTFELDLVEKTTITYDHRNIELKKVTYQSKEKVPVSMILVHEKGLKLDGKNPTILKAHGGFGVTAKPFFDPGIVHFIKQGGVFAYAHIRGGGEKGTEWAKAGKGTNKQNSFDDIISAAEFLIENKYTNQDHLALTGVSHGGLVAAAAGIQRPDLFRAVVPVVAVLDMVRFEKFTVGHFLADEYGTVKDSLSFKQLYDYSPYHNVQEEINYPAMLVITSENDDRIPPFHSYKFVARLQNRMSQKNPILLKVEKEAGHFGPSTYASSTRGRADMYGFILHELRKGK